jgi:hypothetical protein
METMTQTTIDVLPDTEDGTSSVDSLIYWVCTLCYPVPEPGDKALCGFVLTLAEESGIPAPEDSCVVCDHMSEPHAVVHEGEL